jgi:hypothetical protein
MHAITDTDIDRVAAAVAARDREFLYARLAVYELIEEPALLTPHRTSALAALLRGDHQDLFGKALDRLARLDDRYPVLLHALAYARGRGVPEADGIWANIATALTRTAQNRAGDQTGWAEAVASLLTAAAYIVIDDSTTDHGQQQQGKGGPGLPGGAGASAETVYRLAHRTFVEYSWS